jgi:NAD-dependent oxidoreductase involved in siderophore biosynthesis
MKKLLKILRLIAAFVALAVCSHAFAQSEASALKMVKALNLGSNLATMSFRFAKLTHTQMGVAMNVGPALADQWLNEEIANALPKCQDQWDINLAQSWQPLLTDAEFESIAKLKQQSPDLAKFKSVYGQVNGTMQAKSTKLMTDMVTEIITKTMERSMAFKK